MEGEVDATCVQFGSRGEEFHRQGEILPDIWVILMIVLQVAAIKCIFWALNSPRTY